MDMAPPTSAAQTTVAPFFPHPRSVETLTRCMETSPVADASLPSSLEAGGPLPVDSRERLSFE